MAFLPGFEGVVTALRGGRAVRLAPVVTRPVVHAVVVDFAGGQVQDVIAAKRRCTVGVMLAPLRVTIEVHEMSPNLGR
jgi:hypothetical protein